MPELTADLKAASGVACDTASMPDVRPLIEPNRVGEKTAIAAGYEAIMKARPARAGLIKLFPRPPNAIFATPMANTEPKTAIQIGRPGGRVKASRIAVTNALKSTSADGFLNANRTISHSVRRQDIMHTAVRMIDLIPKKNTDATNDGMSATTTDTMIEGTDSPCRICGDVDTCSSCVRVSSAIAIHTFLNKLLLDRSGLLCCHYMVFAKFYIMNKVDFRWTYV